MHRVVPKVGFRKGISLRGEGMEKKTNWSILVHGTDFFEGGTVGIAKSWLIEGMLLRVKQYRVSAVGLRNGCW